MIVADTSVWVDFFNGRPTEQVLRLRYFFNRQEIVVGDLILCEILQGIDSERQASAIYRDLLRFPSAAMVGHDIAIKAASNFRTLRRHGITIRKTIDLLVGTFCIERGYPLLHADRDYEPMSLHLGLLTV